MHLINGIDIDSLFWQACKVVLAYGEVRNPRGMATRSVGPVMMRLDSPRSRVLWNPIRKAVQGFMAGEFTWIITGSDSVEQIEFYNTKMSLFSDDGITLAGAYGPKMVSQLPYVLETLRADPDSRQALITLWQPSPAKSRDIPCTISLQFRRSRGKLDLIASMRSNDLWLGLPYDIFTFTCLQELVAKELGMELGTYYHSAGDLHLYASDLVKAGMASAPTYLNTVSEMMPALATDCLAQVRNHLNNFEVSTRVGKMRPALSVDPFVAWIETRLLATAISRQERVNAD